MILEKARVEKILLVKLRAIGDTVLTLPSAHELKRFFPRAHLAVMVPDHSLEIVSEDPQVDEVIPYRKEWFGNLDHHLAVFRGLQRRGFDLAVCLHSSFRSALLGWMSGARWRVVRNHSGPDWFSNLKVREPKEPKSIIQRDFDALRALGLQPTRGRPVMALGPWARQAAAGLWKQAGFTGKKTVALVPGAGKPKKRWPLEKFTRLASALAGRKIKVLWITAPGENLVLPRSLASKVAPLCFSSLQMLGAVLGRAGWCVGNDSGPRHIAAACGARTLTLFGPEALREWHPYQEKDGHWAVRPESGNIRDLKFERVWENVLKWMNASVRP